MGGGGALKHSCEMVGVLKATLVFKVGGGAEKKLR